VRWAALAALALAALLGGLWGWHAARSSGSVPAGVRIWMQPGVESGDAERIATDFARLRSAVDADFPAHAHPAITLRFYGTHAAFAAALHRLEGVWPERAGDNVGNIVGNTLPLGPDAGMLVHNLAHVYTEWVLDRLTGNAADRQPDPAWLYDGLAEYEADRRSSPVPCRLTGGYVVPLAQLDTPVDWWRVRGTIYQGLEYCEAEDAAAHIVRRIGWTRIERLLGLHPIWAWFASEVGAASRDFSIQAGQLT
jgi:hypothetical protein